jgi:hypothetical protein
MHACNPSYLEDGDQEDQLLEASSGKKLLRPPHLNKQTGHGGIQL